ncbi:MAG: ABC transporter ATP-binding protein [Clostridia bacterium]|nr:ABC transporter ATP-binding protein [Clostridia bacterium]
MGPGPGWRPPWEQTDKLKPQKPKSIKEAPGYIKKVVGGFFYRLFYIFKLVWEARPLLMIAMAFMAVFNGVMPVIGIQITANLMNVLGSLLVDGPRGMESGELISMIIGPLLWQFGYLFVNSLVDRVSDMITSISGEIVTNHVKIKIMRKAKEIDIARFDMPEFYAKLENASREAGMRPMRILHSTFSMVSNVISIVGFVITLTALGWFIPLAVMLLAVPNALITFAYRKKNFNYMKRRSKDRRQMTYYSDLLVNKDMVKEIRLFGLSDTMIDRYKQVFKGYFAGVRRLIRNEGIWGIALSLAATVANCAIFIYICVSVYHGGGMIGDYSKYTAALTSTSSYVMAFISLISSIYEGSLFIENLISFMKDEKRIVPSVPEPVKPLRHCGHTIELRDVSFRYPGTDRDVIKHINLTIEPGATIVMVGLNGAGKTTLIKLLTRLYDPTEGVILLDGRDIREYDVKALYDIFGIIFQDFGKYAVSVRENIAFGQIDKEIVQEEIERAAEESNSADYISKLPRGYDTPLMRYFEDTGIELSIGQWQKLSIARAFYSDSDILILDEPTASLDAIAEQEIFNQFDRLRRDKTTIFVSHRLSSATVASKIIVLKDGELVETGDHAELMRARGHYYNLFSTQAKRYITTADEDINEGNIDIDTYGDHPAGGPPAGGPPAGGPPRGPRPDGE